MYDLNIREESIKKKVADEWFHQFDTSDISGDIDFSVSDRVFKATYLWAEAKKGNKEDIYASIVQLIITVGKAHTFDHILPPPFLGAFDAQKIAFVQYHKLMDIFAQNDFNWKVKPSDHESKEFIKVYDVVRRILDEDLLLFDFDKDKEQLRDFIATNFKVSLFEGIARVEITKYNFVAVYHRWAETVKPTIALWDDKKKWDKVKERGITDIDFYMADLMSRDDVTIEERRLLNVTLNKDFYKFDKVEDDLGYSSFSDTKFTDGQRAYRKFWAIYVRPPKQVFWDFIVTRYRDLLVPQDVRERKGSYFTPAVWVEKSQAAIADVLGYDWQDDCYVWDCAAGSGNLLVGLSDKYHVWASDVDKQNVDVMNDRIKNGANLLGAHVFQFDFLNDPLDKLPSGLKAIIDDPNLRKKLVIYINPPYAEAGNTKTISDTHSHHKPKVSCADSYVARKYKANLGRASNELFALFLMRIAMEIRGCVVAHFSTMKIVQSKNFIRFRRSFCSSLEKLFIVPGNTFDNVGGQFPVGFFVWDTGVPERWGDKTYIADVYDCANGESRYLQKKNVYSPSGDVFITRWLQEVYDKARPPIGWMMQGRNDFLNSQIVYITLKPNPKESHKNEITVSNLMENAVYFSVQRAIGKTWLNNQDQFLYPRDSWITDLAFHSDCLVFTLFHDKLRVRSADGVNHWIPFTPKDVGADDDFTSHFMTDYMSGAFGGSDDAETVLRGGYSTIPKEPMLFTPVAQSVLDAGLALWKYYHSRKNVDVNASLMDIRFHFQGQNDDGSMAQGSPDADYLALIASLRSRMADLASQIGKKLYEHDFLR